MCSFIAIEDLVANALIELMERNGCRTVKLKTLVQYGDVVTQILKDGGECVVIIYSRDCAIDLLQNYSDYFNYDGDLGEEAIILKEGKTAKDLRERFRAYVALNHLMAFINQKSLAALGV